MGAAFIHEKGVTWKNFKHQTFPEFSYEWLEAELDTVATRTAKML